MIKNHGKHHENMMKTMMVKHEQSCWVTRVAFTVNQGCSPEQNWFNIVVKWLMFPLCGDHSPFWFLDGSTKVNQHFDPR